MSNVVAWNADKSHRCPDCHAVAVSGEKPQRRRIYTCCRCGTRFTRWPLLARILPEAGVRCGEHSTIRQGILDEALHVIADPGWRANGLGWESAQDAVRHLKNDTHPSQFSDSADGREHVWTGIIRAGHAYVTDKPNCADECLGIHNSPEGPVDCDGRPI